MAGGESAARRGGAENSRIERVLCKSLWRQDRYGVRVEMSRCKYRDLVMGHAGRFAISAITIQILRYDDGVRWAG